MVAEVVAAFERLSPAPGWPVWKVDHGTELVPPWAVIFDPTPCRFEVSPDGPSLIGHAEVALGGFFADPPTMPGRAPDGHRVWSRDVASREIALTLARRENTAAVPPCPAVGLD